MGSMTSDEDPAPKHVGIHRPEDNATGVVAWLIRVSMLGGSIGFVAALLGNLPVLFAGLLVLVAGCVAVAVLMFKDARRLGQPISRSLRIAIGAALGWLYDYH
jgi:hypothetical protein